MARSILPSTARHSSRERKKAATRRARARNQARLNRLFSHSADLDGFEEPLSLYDLDDVGWDGMVDDRRAADKIGPLLRWAEARIARDPQLSNGDYWARRSHFAALLGDTVMGRHALQHLDALFGDENPWAYGLGPGTLTWAERQEQRRAEVHAEHERRERLLREVLDGAGAHRLNTRIKALTPPIEPRWSYDDEGNRVAGRPSGHSPWLFNGRCDLWLSTQTWGGSEPQRIAFEALTQVHAEMFVPRST